MKTLITGAGGMLGTDLAEVLSGFHSVIGVGRSPAPHLKISYRQVDLTQASNAEALFQEEKPAIIFHSAAMTNVDTCELDPSQAILLNEQMTQHVVSASNRIKAFLVYFSTDYVFDGKKQGEYKEDDQAHPLNVYGKTKLLGENAVIQNADNFAIFRVSWLYGKCGKSFPRTILEKSKQQNSFDVVSDQFGRPTSTRDLAEAFRNLLSDAECFKKMNRQIFHLANSGFCSWAQFAVFLLREAGYTKISVNPIFSDQLNRPAVRPRNSVLSVAKSEEVLGLKLRPWGEAARQFVKEYAALSVNG